MHAFIQTDLQNVSRAFLRTREAETKETLKPQHRIEVLIVKISVLKIAYPENKIKYINSNEVTGEPANSAFLVYL